MKNIMQWMFAAILVCGTSVFTSCSSDNDDAVGRERYSFTYTAKEGVLTMDIAERNTKTTARYTVSDGKLTLTEDVPQPARYTVFVYGNAEGIADKVLKPISYRQ